MIGLGLALAQPDRRVAVLTGDGDMLMGIGSLATIGVKQPNNLAIVVLDNAHYGETGMQPSATQSGIDLVAMALACRFKHARAVSRIDETADVRALAAFRRRADPGQRPHQGRRHAAGAAVARRARDQAAIYRRPKRDGLGLLRSRNLHRLNHFRIGPAAAQIAGEIVADVIVARVRMSLSAIDAT